MICTITVPRNPAPRTNGRSQHGAAPGRCSADAMIASPGNHRTCRARDKQVGTLAAYDGYSALCRRPTKATNIAECGNYSRAAVNRPVVGLICPTLTH